MQEKSPQEPQDCVHVVQVLVLSSHLKSAQTQHRRQSMLNQSTHNVRDTLLHLLVDPFQLHVNSTATNAEPIIQGKKGKIKEQDKHSLQCRSTTGYPRPTPAVQYPYPVQVQSCKFPNLSVVLLPAPVLCGDETKLSETGPGPTVGTSPTERRLQSKKMVKPGHHT